MGLKGFSDEAAKNLEDLLAKEIADEFDRQITASIAIDFPDQQKETRIAFEKARSQDFDKYPALKDSWEQYKLMEKMCGVK